MRGGEVGGGGEGGRRGSGARRDRRALRRLVGRRIGEGIELGRRCRRALLNSVCVW